MIPLELLPRRCPTCQDATIVGHGRRQRQAHDDLHTSLWIRRGKCQRCGKTFTILPDWLMPSAPYTLRCRHQACEHLDAGESAEASVPVIRDPDRSPDGSTLRRWFSRLCALRTQLADALLRVSDEFRAALPTSLALDWMTIGRILQAEARSP